MWRSRQSLLLDQMCFDCDLLDCQAHGLSDGVIAATPLPTAMKCAFAVGRRLRRAYDASQVLFDVLTLGYTPDKFPPDTSPRASARAAGEGGAPM